MRKELDPKKGFAGTGKRDGIHDAAGTCPKEK